MIDIVTLELHVFQAQLSAKILMYYVFMYFGPEAVIYK